MAIRRRRNYKLGISPWLLPVGLTIGLVVTGGIFAVKAWRDKKKEKLT